MELYHVLNRGVEKRNLFEDDGDRVRFVHNLYAFNDRAPANNTRRRMNDIVSRSLGRESLVELHGWCLMDNHYHLLLSEVIEGGLSMFIRRLNIGYAKFFNEKHHRSGVLFQGRTKKIRIASEPHLHYILHYIHLNPLDFLDGAHGWRGGTVDDPQAVLRHLETYRWSSFLDYCGERNFPSLLTQAVFAEIHGNYRQTLASYVRSMAQTDELRTLVLE